MSDIYRTSAEVPINREGDKAFVEFTIGRIVGDATKGVWTLNGAYHWLDPILHEDDEPILDENDKPVLDDNGDPTFYTGVEPVLDSEGNPIYTRIPYEGFRKTIKSPRIDTEITNAGSSNITATDYLGKVVQLVDFRITNLLKQWNSAWTRITWIKQ